MLGIIMFFTLATSHRLCFLALVLNFAFLQIVSQLPVRRSRCLERVEEPLTSTALPLSESDSSHLQSGADAELPF